MNNDMRLAFEAFCKRTASPGASSSEYYWMLFQAGAAYNDALRSRLAGMEAAWRNACERGDKAVARLAEADALLLMAVVLVLPMPSDKPTEGA